MVWNFLVFMVELSQITPPVGFSFLLFKELVEKNRVYFKSYFTIFYIDDFSCCNNYLFPQ